MNRFSIRWKLTLWNTLALAVLLCGIGLIVFAILRHVVYEQMDRVLQTQFQVLAEDEGLVAEPEARLKHWVEEFHDHVGVYGVIFDSQGQIVASTEQLAPASIPAFSSATPTSMRFDSREVPLIGWQRTIQGTLAVRGERYEVMFMLPLEETRRELSQVATILWSVLPFSLLLAGGIGYLLARKALAPIDQLRRAADQITAERLDQQLELPNPHDELGRLGQTINAMTKRLEASFAEIRRFTADASHELRTPIAVIRMETEVAMKQPLGAEEYQVLAGSVLEECEHLTRLTDQLLTLSREDATLVPHESTPVALRELVRDAAATMRPLAEAKGQSLIVDLNESVIVTGDAARLRQVVYNLLDNAIKYTPEGGQVSVSLRTEGHAGVLKVSDTGIGIGAEDLPHVMKRFYRVDKARSRAAGGTGLGLSIVDSIVTAHQGQVVIVSRPGEGTTCTVTLPVTSDTASGINRKRPNQPHGIG